MLNILLPTTTTIRAHSSGNENAKIIGSVEVFIQWQIKRLPSESSIEYWHEYNTGVQDDVSLCCYDFTFYTDSD